MNSMIWNLFKKVADILVGHRVPFVALKNEISRDQRDFIRIEIPPLTMVEEVEKKPRGYIESYGTFLPPTTVSTSKTVKDVLKVKFIPLQYVTGIKKRRASNDFSAFDLAFRAVEKCLARSAYKPEDIDLIVCCNICKSSAGGKIVHYEPTTAIKMRQALGFKNAICFDLNNACAGMFTGIYIVNKLIGEGAIRRAIVFSGEHISHLATTAQREIENLRDPRLACLTLGDAGAAVLIDATTVKNQGILHFDMKTFAEHSDLCTAFCSKEAHGGIIMHTNSSKITRYGRDESVKLFSKMIKENIVPFDKKTLVITHQVSKRLPKEFVKGVNKTCEEPVISQRQMFNNVGNVGNTASTAHFVALAKAIASGKVKNGKDIVFLIQASGLNIGLVHYKMDELPAKMKRIKKHKTSTPKNVEAHQNTGSFALVAPRLMIANIATVNDIPTDTVKLAAKAADICLHKSGIRHDEVNYLIHCGHYRSGTVEEPSHAAMIAGQLNLSHSDNGKSLFAFDVVNGSLGWLNAVYTASFLIDSDRKQNIIVTASECDENKQYRSGDPLNITEMGSAVALTASVGRSGFSHFHFRSFCEFVQENSVILHCDSSNIHYAIHQKDGFEEKLIDAIVITVGEQMALLGMRMDEFSAFALPQRSASFLFKLADKMGIRQEAVINATGETDHFSSSIPMTLQKYIGGSRRASGEKILVIDVTSGIQVGMAIYTC